MLADLVLEHEAVLHGVRDGVVAVDQAGAGGRIAMANDEARRLLGDGVRAGAPVAVLAPRQAELAVGGVDVDEQLVLTGSRTLAVTGRRVSRHGRDLGTVLTVRDRNAGGAPGPGAGDRRALFDALRAQSHEHSNRLHVLAGLLHLGHVEEASEYVDSLSVDPLSAGDDVARNRDPYLRGLLAAKAAAAAEGPRRPAWVEVAVAGDDTDLQVAVTDSGAGLSVETSSLAFTDGWTTRVEDSRHHGLGLALARQTARRHGGDVEVLATAGPDHGAVFVATLRGVLEAPATRVHA